MSAFHSGSKKVKYQSAYTSQVGTFISRGLPGYNIKDLYILEEWQDCSS